MAIYSNKTFGYCNSTKFTFWYDQPEIVNPDVYVSGVLWNFGDGESSTVESTVSHTYKKEGVFDVTITIFITNKVLETTEEHSSFTKTVKIVNFLQKSIYFDNVPPPTLNNHINRFPFRVKYTSDSIKDHNITIGLEDLRSFFSNNEKYIDPQYPHWYILDNNLTLTNFISGNQSLIYVSENSNLSDAQNGYAVGVSGYADFYVVNESINCIDACDINNSISLIHATLFEKNDNGFINSDVTASFPHIFTWNVPNKLNINHDIYSPLFYNNVVNNSHPLCITTINNENQEFYTPLKTNSFDHNLLYYTSVSGVSSTFINVNAYDEDSFLDLNFKYPTVFGLNNSIYMNLTATNYKETFPGICETFFEIASASTLEYSVSANALFELPDVSGNLINPNLLLPNAKVGILNKIQIQFHNGNCYFNNKIFKIPKLNLENEWGNLHSISSIVSIPSPHYKTWVADQDSGYAYLFDNEGKILTYINSKKIEIPSDSIEISYLELDSYFSEMILDKNLNLWASINDSNYITKFDLNGKCSEVLELEQNKKILKFNISCDDYLWILTEDQNNSSLQLLKINLTDLTDIAILSDNIHYYNFIEFDSNNQIILSYNNNNQSIIERWSEDKVELLQTHQTPSIISDLSLDYYENIWYSISDGVVVKLNYSNISKLLTLSSEDFTYPLNLKNIITDHRQISFAIDSNNNLIFIIKENNGSLYTVETLTINPSLFNNKEIYNDPSDVEFDSSYIESLGYKNGDVNNSKWNIKYSKILNPLLSSNYLNLSGSAGPIVFLNSNNLPKIKKINESFNFAETFKNFAQIPGLSQNTLLLTYFKDCLKYNNYQNYLNSDSFIYEKISNFNLNNSDIETCTYQKLKDYAYLVNYNLKLNYVNVPMAIRRLIDLTSINNFKLAGFVNTLGLNLENKYGIAPNRGNFLKHTDTITNLQPLVLRDYINNKFKFVMTPNVLNLSEYTVDYFAKKILNLSAKWREQYEFYEYISSTELPPPENSIIDWNSEDTNLNIQDVLSFKWQKPDGIVESLFNIELQRGLDFIQI